MLVVSSRSRPSAIRVGVISAEGSHALVFCWSASRARRAPAPSQARANRDTGFGAHVPTGSSLYISHAASMRAKTGGMSSGADILTL